MQTSRILCGLLVIVLCVRPLEDVCWAASPLEPFRTSGASESAATGNQAIQAATNSAKQEEEANHSKNSADVGMYRPGAGTIILAELTKSLDAAKLRAGENIDCTVIQDLLYKGKIIIPHGSKVTGHVTEAVARTKERPESRLGMVFDSIVLKDKNELPFQHPALIQAVASPITMGSVPTTRMSDMPIFMPKGSTTGGAAVDALAANASLAGANMPSTSGAISGANRGVIGLSGLALDPVKSLISSRKGNVKLPFAAQLLLRVSDAPPSK